MPGAIRRRVLSITAAGAACLGLGGAGLAPLRHQWQGSALGASASLTLYDPDPRRARRLIEQALAEIDRLDAIFSLQRSESAIGRLNRTGSLARPPLDLLTVLEAATRISDLSEGAFDATVQPLWRAFAMAGGPSLREAERAAALVDWRAVEASAKRVALGRPGMAITLNGIAQGYVTDRVADLLRDAGLDHALVALGEQRALGPRPDGRPWRLASELGTIPLMGDALAISGPAPAVAGTSLPHLIDPKAARPAAPPSPVAVVAPRAMLADGLSTALAAADGETRARIAARLPGLQATWRSTQTIHRSDSDR